MSLAYSETKGMCAGVTLDPLSAWGKQQVPGAPLCVYCGAGGRKSVWVCDFTSDLKIKIYTVDVYIYIYERIIVVIEGYVVRQSWWRHMIMIRSTNVNSLSFMLSIFTIIIFFFYLVLLVYD